MKSLSKVKIAVFDIDGTIFRSSLFIEHMRAMVDSGLYPKSAWTAVTKDYNAWLNREADYNIYLNKLVAEFVKYIPGKKEKDLKNLAKKVLSEKQYQVYKYTRNLLSELKKKNYYLIAISGSPSFLVDDFSKSLGFNKSFGTEMESIKGVFTGGVVAGGKESKIDRLNKYIEEQGFFIDWKGSYAIGDTLSDLSLLEKVGQPIAFNPNLELIKIAQRKGWKIVVERKDVIYQLEKFKIAIT